jgi:hypothetical protein
MVDRAKFEVPALYRLDDGSWSRQPLAKNAEYPYDQFFVAPDGTVACGSRAGWNMLSRIPRREVEKQWLRLKRISAGELEVARRLTDSGYENLTYRRDVERLKIEADRLGFLLVPKVVVE